MSLAALPRAPSNDCRGSAEAGHSMAPGARAVDRLLSAGGGDRPRVPATVVSAVSRGGGDLPAL